jgi:DNA replication protein DnaC
MVMTSENDLAPQHDPLLQRIRALGLFGLAFRWNEVRDLPWIPTLLEFEESDRQRRSLERRLRNARIGAFKPIADFDWEWPRKLDRESVDDLFTLGFIDEGSNVVFIGQNGVGKTMIIKNLAHQALVHGHTVRFTTASDMLAELAAQDSSQSLARRLRRFCNPALLCVDEVGYLSYDNRYADLLFEVVSRRYQARRPIVLSTNKVFDDWSQVFPNAACVVTLIDRLVHRCEQVEIDADSYRLKEAKEQAAAKAKARSARKAGRKSSKP